MQLGGSRVWVERIALGIAAAVTVAILAFYLKRLSVPLPIFGVDAGAYLIRALYPDDIVARNPYVAAVHNGVHLSLIRAAFRVGVETGAPYMLIDRAINGAMYLAGMLALWWASVRRVGVREQLALLLLSLGFAYYRFAFSNMAEGPYVGALALVGLVTRLWWRRRPVVHALAAGLGCAVLVLCKPHGIAVVCALGALALLDAAPSRDWVRLALRAAVFAGAFLALGNLIEFAAQEPVSNPFAFFLGGMYGDVAVAKPPPGAATLGLQALAIMGCSSLILAAAPAIIGAADLAGRWRIAGRAYRPNDRDALFLLVLLSLGATLVMVAVFSMKVASTPSETHRLWGRYYEFFAPMLWLAAAPALASRPSRGVALACGAVTLLALAGFLGLLQRGWIILAWDSTVLTAFFDSYAPRGVFLPLPIPLRAVSAAATLVAAIAYALRARPLYVGCALLLTLSALSTWLDRIWLGDLARHRAALERDLQAIGPALPKPPARVVLIAQDVNVSHLGFLELGARPFIVVGDPLAPPPGALDGAEAVLATGKAPPAGAWSPGYRGAELSLWRPASASPALQAGP